MADVYDTLNRDYSYLSCWRVSSEDLKGRIQWSSQGTLDTGNDFTAWNSFHLLIKRRI